MWDHGIHQADASPEAAARPAPSCKTCSKSLLENGTAEVKDNAGRADMKQSLDGGVPSSFSLKTNTGFNTSGNSKKVSTSPLANKK